MTAYASLLFLTVLVVTLFAYFRYERRKQKYSPFNEPMLRSPGYSLTKQRDELFDQFLYPFFVVAIAPLTLGVMADKLSPAGSNVMWSIIIVVEVVCVVRIIVLIRRAVRLRLGLEGEIYTGQELNYLMRDGAYVYHDIPYTYGNIDHIVVSTGGVFAVETKAIRKPAKKQGRAEHKLTVEGNNLMLPHGRTAKPIKQALCHAAHLRQSIAAFAGISAPVTPVVAIPGWFINTKPPQAGALVINPKRGNSLRKLVQRSLIAPEDVDRIAAHIESIARSVDISSDMHDPDASTKYDLLNNRRQKDRGI